jgi:hypothetical protein
VLRLLVLEGVVGVMVRVGRVMLLGWTSSSTCRLSVGDRRHHVQRVVWLLRLLLRPVVMMLVVRGSRGRAKVGLRVVRRRARLVRRMVRVLAMVSRCRCGAL